MAKKNAVPSPLQLAHAKRKEASEKLKKLTPAARVNEVAPGKVSAAIRAIRKVGVLGTAKTVTKNKDGENVYSPTYALSAEQKSRILSTLRHEVDQLDRKLTPQETDGKRKKGGIEFSF